MEDDWRAILNRQYTQPEYQQLLGNSQQGQLDQSNSLQNLLDLSNNYDTSLEDLENLNLNNEATSNPRKSLSLVSPYAAEYRKKLQLFQQYEGIRFPPIPKYPISELIKKEDYQLPLELQQRCQKAIQENSEYANVHTTEAYAGVQFLENMLTSFVDKLDEIRKLIFDHGNYVYSLSRPPADVDDTEYINTVILNNLSTLKIDLKQLMEEMIIFQPHKVDEMVNNEAAMSSNRDIFHNAQQQNSNPINLLKNSLIERARKLSDEITISILNVDQLRQYSLSLVHFPPNAVPAIAGIHSQWDAFIRLQRKQKSSFLAVALKVYMSARNLKVNDILYQYLQSPIDYGFMLIFSQYTFEPKEFAGIMEFLLHEAKVKKYLEASRIKREKERLDQEGDDFEKLLKRQLYLESDNNETKGPEDLKNASKSKQMDMNPSSPYFYRPLNDGTVLHSIQTLIFHDCHLTDSHCYQLSTVLPRLSQLQYFDLSQNEITYAGLALLITAIFENRVYFKQWKLDHNRLNADAAILIGQALEYLPNLQYLSMSGNLIKDQGCYAILQGCVSQYRRVFHELPVLERTRTESEPVSYQATTRKSQKLIRNEEVDEEEDDEEEDDFEEEEEILLEEEAEEVSLGHRGKTKRRFPVNCYLQDYFSGYLSRDLLREHQIQQFHDSKRQYYQWVNAKEEEFEMDLASEYSKHSLPEATGEEVEDLTYQEMLQKNETLSLNQIHDTLTVDQYIAHYPSFVKKVLKLRVKLAAIAMFLRVKRRGHKSLETLALDNCGLSSAIMPMLSTVLTDNNKIRELNLSRNKTLLGNDKSCALLSKVISLGSLESLQLIETGLKDTGITILAQGLMKSKNLKFIDLSNNAMGPTGSNIIANLAKEFRIESLSIGSGKVRPAPFPMKNFPWSDVPLDGGRHGSIASGSQFTRLEEEEADDGSFVDTDLFDGEDEEEGGFDDETLANSRDDGTFASNRKSSVNKPVSTAPISPNTKKKLLPSFFSTKLFRKKTDDDSLARCSKKDTMYPELQIEKEIRRLIPNQRASNHFLMMKGKTAITTRRVAATTHDAPIPAPLLTQDENGAPEAQNILALCYAQNQLGIAGYRELYNTISGDVFEVGIEDIEATIQSIKLTFDPTLLLLHPGIVTNYSLLKTILAGIDGRANVYSYKTLRTTAWNEKTTSQVIYNDLKIRTRNEDLGTTAESVFDTIRRLEIDLDIEKTRLKQSLGALLTYLQEHTFLLEQGKIFVSAIERFPNVSYMRLDENSYKALQIFNEDYHPNWISNYGKSKEGFSLYGLYDRTCSIIGRQKLREWMAKPFSDINKIRERQEGVKFTLREPNFDLLSQLKFNLRHVGDIPKMILRIKKVEAKPKDWCKLYTSLVNAATIIEKLEFHKSCSHEGSDDWLFMRKLVGNTNSYILRTVIKAMANVIDFGASLDHSELMINEGIDPVLDEKREIYSNLEHILLEAGQVVLKQSPYLEQFNIEYIPQVGYLIVIDSSEVERLSRSGCIKNSEEMNAGKRIADPITPAASTKAEPNYQLTWIFNQRAKAYFKHEVMKSLDASYGDLKTEISIRQKAILVNLEEDLLQYEMELLQLSIAVATLDAYMSLGEIAFQNKLVCPQITEDEVIVIKNGRHLLQELTVDTFVPNDTFITRDKCISIITGPNGSGKSIYLKQVGLIVYMAHIGSFVPCEKAIIGLTDQIFTRIFTEESATDYHSSFTSDVTQVSRMLNHHTRKSLCLLDEFGKGTDPYDGISLLAAVIKQLAESHVKAIFSIHYTEVLQGRILPNHIFNSINCFCMDTIKEANPQSQEESLFLESRVIPLYKLKYGIDKEAFGIECAEAMGVLPAVIQRAREIKFCLNTNSPIQQYANWDHQNPCDIFDDSEKATLKELILQMMKEQLGEQTMDEPDSTDFHFA